MERGAAALLAGLLCLFLAVHPAYPQQPRKPSRPGLIRDTDIAEGKDEADAQKPKDFNPLLAEKAIKIGDHYFKMKNYVAAIERYREAIEYHPNRFDAYDALGRAYEKNKQPAKALDTYKFFVGKFPQSPKVPGFRERIARLEKKAG